jgi:type IV pilus assembly protein PilY1
MYLAMFKPTEKSFWKGNIKKYGIATKNSNGLIVDGNNSEVTDSTIKVGDILDAAGKRVMDSDNKIKDTARSYWSAEADGEDVELGGIGKILQDRNDPRKIYTYLETETDLTLSSNAFGPSNSAITPEMLGLASGDTTGREKIFNFIYGLDAYDWEGLTGVPDGITNVKRSWIQGAFIHSRPLVIHYPNRSSVVFVGSNNGMLQAFDDLTGEEMWGFIPRNLLSSLKNFNGEELQFFVDGAPKVYMQRDSNGNLTTGILIFGLRRGGNRYIALDIRDPEKPKFLYEISPSTTGFGELGQTWSTPLIGKIKLSDGDRVAAFIGAGYDQNQDNEPVSANDTKGRAVYVIDVLTGSLLWSYSRAQNTNMKYSIPSDIARVDTNGDGKVDRLYVGDMGGQVWRFDIGDPDSTKWTAKIIFDSNPGSSNKKKLFYPPDVTLEKGNYEMLFFGTGDREHPKSVMFENRIYAVKDKNASQTLTETSLVDVTDEKATLNALSTKSGWYIRLENAGEKSLSHSVVFDGVVYYTTFTPTFGEPGDICALKEGEGRLYALRYMSGNAVFNLDDSLDGVISQPTDQSEIIGPSIPSGVIITFIGGTATAYVGVGGGVYPPQLTNNRSIIPINWRTVTK